MQDLNKSNVIDIQDLLDKPFTYLVDLKISYIVRKNNFIKLLCVKSSPVKEDANLVQSSTEWIYVNQLYSIKVYDKHLQDIILDNWSLKDLTKANMYFKYAIVTDECKVGKFEGKTKNDYPIFWARDYYYTLSDKFEIELKK